MTHKKVFISYSHDSEEHKDWVRTLASNLMGNGIDVILDQWDLRAGEDIPQFVEKSIFECDRVLLICTKPYVEKANKRQGGVGLEALVINSSLMEDLGTTKFVAVVRQQPKEIIIPTLLKSRLYINLSQDIEFTIELKKLIKEIHELGNIDKPKLGENPFAETYSSSNKNAIHDKNESIRRKLFANNDFKIDKVKSRNAENIEKSNEKENKYAASLDLARVYMEIGDFENSKVCLIDVMNNGNLVQQKEAKELITKINQ